MDLRLSVLLFLGAASTAYAAGIDTFYSYGLNIDKVLDMGDDVSSDEFKLNMPIVFYSQRKNSVWVNVNGFISFDGTLPAYTGELIPFGKEVIAPFYADIDTTSTGDVFYRETTQQTELDQAKQDINKVFQPERPFVPSALLVVTWNTVGAYSQQFMQNTFQLVIGSDGFRSYAIFIYLDRGVNWLQADLKEGIAKVSAQAGFDSGAQNFPAVIQPGSSLPEAKNWPSQSNCDRPGVWMYQIGYLTAVRQPDLSRIMKPVPAGPASECSQRCSRNGVCVDKCCVCNAGYSGNGVSCRKVAVPTNRTDAVDSVWMSGKTVGTINDQEMGRPQIVSYFTFTESRSYTAISKLPPLTGYPLQLVIVLGELMGWLFARGGPSNGFVMTGAVLNYSAIMTFGTDVANVQVRMNGLKADGSPHDPIVSVNGNLPRNIQGNQALFDDYQADYVKVKPGKYLSDATRTYKIKGQGKHEFRIKEEVNFHECKEAPKKYSVRHSAYYVVYNENELTARFSILSQTQAEAGAACAKHDCHHNADCIPKGSGYTCTCKQGYEGSGRACADLNECATGDNTCSKDANCYNTDGGYICNCKTGYSGDGYFCAEEEKRKTCRDLKCHTNAVCEMRGDIPLCACKTGFRGDGTLCEAIVVTCNEADICDANANCLYNGDNGRYECQCKDGFSGDGESCDTPVDASCAYCSFNAECVYNRQGLFYRCVCEAGYTGDGRTCQLIDQRRGESATTNSATTVVVTSAPPPASTTGAPQGTTDAGLLKDKNCKNDKTLCGENFDCAFVDGKYACVCRSGFLRSGSLCVPADCVSHKECGENALCQYSLQANRYKCECNSGFQGDGLLCTTTAVTTCNEVNVCHPDADCFDTAVGPKCVCRSGFAGDGKACTPVQDNCMTRPALCDRNAVCSRTSAGDYVCICNPGYRGDGSSCSPLNERGNYLLFSQGMSVFRVPFYQAGNDRGRRILYKSGQTLIGLAADCKDRSFFYSDINSGTISRASLDNTSDSRVIIAGLKSPEGLAVDWISRTLFFTDSALDRIEVADLDGKYRKVIVDSGLVNPRAISVDPLSGKIYWADWDRKKARIEVANTDGTGRRVLVETGLSLPNGLTYDAFRRQVCWADAGTQKLECVQPDGSGRTVIYNYANYPFSVTTFRDNFYWTDWNKNAIQSIPRDGDVLGSSIPFPIGGNGKAYSIEPVPSHCSPGTSKCTYNNGDCKFLCLPTSNYDATCACPDNINQDECNQIFRS